MTFNKKLDDIRSYFQEKFDIHGATPRGADWNSVQAQFTRFEQLTKIIDQQQNYSILDYGCGYGALANYLQNNGFDFEKFFGFDILDTVVQKAHEIFSEEDRFIFTTNLDSIPKVDYSIASGVFNIRLQSSYEDWTAYTIKCLENINQKTRRGFSVNFLTKYSDADRMVAELYYADPGFLFDYCKTHFSRNVALLHDYNLYDFTILVRKEL
jgi:SAM-dependent methyltransferase